MYFDIKAVNSEAGDLKKIKFSEFELKVIEALIQNDPEEDQIRFQLLGASVTERDYTGVGCFTKMFILKNDNRLAMSHRHVEGTPTAHLEHPDLKEGASAFLWFEKGYVSTLECFAYGENWPKDESQFKILSSGHGMLY